ncbi:MAG: hypothetical protein M1818_008486 [Claussenomyces sp. TS43310]|nr:MAG: hypothetical protein M1818_008486 [Claussenomyces sp. TS43310]
MTTSEKAQAHGRDEDIEGEKNQWKFRAPYKVHEKDNSFKSYLEGNCHCGRIKFHLDKKKPLDSKFCHCTTCQVLHGAPFGWTAIFDKDDINFTHGHHDLLWYDSMEKTTKHKLPCKVSCAYCRTPIMDEGKNKILMFPTLIKFKTKKDRENFAPQYHMFYPQRVVDVKDGLPKWTKMKEGEESELLQE